MAIKPLAPLKAWEARRTARAERARADAELADARLPSPRHAWRVEELIADERRLQLARQVTDVVLASDPLSSVAYATEAALVVLIGATAGAAHLAFPLSLAIATLLAIVLLSYRQTVLVYESSGGAYVVAKENLGRLPSLVAAAALLTDYVLTVAVSVAAGVLALTSAATSLRGHELTLSIASVLLIAIANLRGVKEAGLLFALPTYGFVASIFALVGAG